MRLRFTPQARRHLDAIAEYLAERSPAASRSVGQRIHETIQLLTNFPLIGREGSLRGTRELVVPGLPYIVVYRVDSDGNALVVLGVYHGAQRRPGQGE